ncbi:MAG TPA: isopeptide-forming domain-containing fimbrial protein [Planctomycetes bacterium]|nr:isopeptide-forming domain-containing fimbrial protein [Fuerstiella sp.]HIK94600.1 isopeptide-forming domain-containing fimbrial protein [Planctomycetota bacterium]
MSNLLKTFGLNCRFWLPGLCCSAAIVGCAATGGNSPERAFAARAPGELQAERLASVETGIATYPDGEATGPATALQRETWPAEGDVPSVQANYDVIDSHTDERRSAAEAEDRRVRGQSPSESRTRDRVLPVSQSLATGMAGVATTAGFATTRVRSNTAGVAGGAATTFRAAEPRMPSAQPNSPPAASMTVAASPLAQAYPDEYIFDGGDRGHPVHYHGGAMAGLDTEDTVAEFKDHTGANHVEASNRVAVYAPRFGAVRTVTGLSIDVAVNKAAGATDISGLGKLHDQRGLDVRVRNSRASGLGTRRSASGVETAQPAHLSRGSNTLAENRRVSQGLENKSSSGPGTLEMSQVFELNLEFLASATSNIRTGFGQAAAISQATLTRATFRVQSTVGVEEKRGRKGRIHLTKEASSLTAKSGDIITFKIHFRNIGDHNVHDVRIIDNLTPRLKYVAGSGEVDLADGSGGGLSVLPNAEGSQTLEFTLDTPLHGGATGTITFQAKVL